MYVDVDYYIWRWKDFFYVGDGEGVVYGIEGGRRKLW